MLNRSNSSSDAIYRPVNNGSSGCLSTMNVFENRSQRSDNVNTTSHYTSVTNVPRFSDVLRSTIMKEVVSANEDSQTSAADDDDSYQTVVNRRSSKRLRTEINRKQMNVSNSASSKSSKTNNKSRQFKPLLIGKGAANNSLKAARAWFPKKVYYVGNFDLSCQVDDVRGILTAADISVRTIHKLGQTNRETQAHVKTKARQPFCSAFRVCIEAKDEHLFLNDSIWPSDIVIRYWSLTRRKMYQLETKL